MDHQQIYHLIKHPEKLNQDTLYELRTLLARYPYYQTVRLLYLKNLFLLHDSSFSEELRKAAILVSDRKILFYMIEGDRYIIHPQELIPAKDEDSLGDRTLTLIDAFLAEQPTQEEHGNAVPIDLMADYTSYFLRDEGKEAVLPKIKPESKTIESEKTLSEQENLIENYLAKSGNVEELPQTLEELEAEARGEVSLVPVKAEPVLDADKVAEEIKKPNNEDAVEEIEDDEDSLDESYFTETLAKIYVKQRRYSKALKIIKKLNLKYPKKNSYFADQIRFLEKLIINEKTNK
ncbi:tetratricopeptide repeat protein [Phocaeicola oris]|uniref:tetratricopeptide repeat protein n=1 Tax=Phocaeicola oris TaxID=2896850 RepID=UPI00234E464A|nr:tetratricopeptide repeat protein [Phocaeicola oris]MCE2615677.1 tetratricopeptide repeat protein [Phocaeicola oris]